MDMDHGVHFPFCNSLGTIAAMASQTPQSDYERLRAERIERNNTRLASLGLLDVKKKIKSVTTPKKKRPHRKHVTPSPARASRRVKRRVDLFQPSFDDYSANHKPRNKRDQYVGDRVAKLDGGVLFRGTITAYHANSDSFTCVYDESGREFCSREDVMKAKEVYQEYGGKKNDKMKSSTSTTKVETKTAKAKPKARCDIPMDALSSPLSKQQKKTIHDRIEGDFLGKFEDYLTDVDEISDSNRRNVLRQVTKLANGEGIRYDSKAYGWPEGCYFMKGVEIGPCDDIMKLMDIGQQCEDDWGRDHGNGWLLSHPLKKLYQFQQYCLE